MMKKILGLLSLILIVLAAFPLISGRFIGTQASFIDTSSSEFLTVAASLDLNLNEEQKSSLEIEMGEIKPGDSGTVDISMKNTGTLPGILCITSLRKPPEILLVKSEELCSITVNQRAAADFSLQWQLPVEAHGTGIDGQSFEFSYLVLFENGFKIAKQVVLSGTIIDPVDTSAPKLADTAPGTPTATDTQGPGQNFQPQLTSTAETSETTAPTGTELPTPTPSATATATIEPSQTPPPADVPLQAPTVTPLPPATEPPLPAPTVTDTPEPPPTATIEPTAVPTESEAPTPELPAPAATG